MTDGAGIVAPLRETPRGRSYQLRIMAVSAAITLVGQLSGHHALNLLDRNSYPELTAMLKRALHL